VTPARVAFERMLAAGKDGALLRFSLGQECLKAGEPADAARHLAQAVQFDSGYTAAWKLYARALTESGRHAEAISAYRDGIAVAQTKGDKQALREMQVFLRRAEKLVPLDPA
jgi:predicted Zn-dependent protease